MISIKCQGEKKKLKRKKLETLQYLIILLIPGSKKKNNHYLLTINCLHKSQLFPIYPTRYNTQSNISYLREKKRKRKPINESCQIRL